LIQVPDLQGVPKKCPFTRRKVIQHVNGHFLGRPAPNLGLSVMLLSGAEVAATSVPDKSMTLIPKLAVV